MRVSEICQRDVRTISKNQTLQEAVDRMGNRLTKLPVMDGGKIVGIVTMRDILGVVGSSHTKSPEHIHVSGIMKKGLKTLPPDAEVGEAVRLMAENDISSILILEGERLYGLVTKTDILRTCTGIDRQIREFLVKAETVSLGHSLPHVREVMFRKNISIIPVTDNGKFIGTIGIRDISQKILKFKKDVKKHQDAIRNMAVEDFYRQDTASIKPGATVGEAAMRLLEEKRTSLPVVERGELIGIISKTDLLKALMG